MQVSGLSTLEGKHFLCVQYVLTLDCCYLGVQSPAALCMLAGLPAPSGQGHGADFSSEARGDQEGSEPAAGAR